jgi:hypothetical protein
MKKISENHKFKFELNTEELDRERKERKVTNILEKDMYDNKNGRSLDKTQLANWHLILLRK